MSNPAILLHGILSGWSEPGSETTWDVRGGEDFLAFIDEHHLAMKHLVAISSAIDGLEASGRETGHLRKNFRRWTSWVLNAGGCWKGHQQIQYPLGMFVNDESALDMLRELGEMLKENAPQVIPKSMKSLESVITEGLDLTRTDESLPEKLRKHLYTLLAEARNCIENYETLGEFHLQAAADRLLVGLNLAKEASAEPQRWSNIRDKFAYPVAVGITLGAPAAVAQIVTGPIGG